MRRFLITLAALATACTAAVAAHEANDISVRPGRRPEMAKVERAGPLGDDRSNGQHPEMDRVERAVLFDDLVVSKPGYAPRGPYANDVAAADPHAVLGE